MKTMDRKDVTVAHLYKFALEMLGDKRPVYFTNQIFGNLRYTEYGVLYRVIPEEETPESFTVKDPWESYDLKGLDRAFLDADAKEAVGKYYVSRAKYLAKMNQNDLSDDFLEKALSAAGDRHSVLKEIAIFHMTAGKHDGTRNVLKKAVKLNPFDPDQYNMLAMIAHYKRDYNEALVNYDKSLELKGKNISTLMNRGILYEQMGDKEANPGLKKGYYQKALDDFEESKKIEPANPLIAKTISRISYKLSR
jgi:tetratricopeptide (TPR) repeat protein